MIVSGFDLRLTPLHRYVSVEDYRRAARRRLPDFVWAYLDGGAEDLVTLRGNRTGFAAWALRWRVMRGTGRPDLATQAAGMPLSLPVMIAPTGYTGLAHWEGERCAVRAANAAGTQLVLSTVSSWSIEEVAEAARQPPAFQLYPREGDLTARLMDRAWRAGYRTLFVTADVPTVGLREGERRNGMSMPPSITPGRLLNIAMHPRWAWNALRHKRLGGRSLVSSGKLSDAAEALAIQMRHVTQASMGWDDFAWMRDQWKGRLYVKGMMDPEDAVKAVEIGADGVVVSNHGGRQLDHAPSAIAALPGIVDAIGDRAEVLLDGGVRRGTDVVKALALGAKAVLIGRPYIYGMAVAGEQGVAGVLEIFRSEIERTLHLMGVRSVRELDRSWLIPRQGGVDDPADPSTRFDTTIRPHGGFGG
jgi:isopentenyl diphosphate isomerase/L-lactate dehydrogenase-like FMN-dependent dehydrogenase